MAAKNSGVGIVRNIALVGVPLLVAVAVAVAIVSMRDGRSDEVAVPTQPAEVALPTDPAVRAFCEQTKETERQIKAFAEGQSGVAVPAPSNSQIAEIVAQLDTDAIDVASAPSAIRADLAYIVERQDQAVRDLQAADPGTDPLSVLAPELITRFSSVIEYHTATCPQT